MGLMKYTDLAVHMARVQACADTVHQYALACSALTWSGLDHPRDREIVGQLLDLTKEQYDALEAYVKAMGW